MSLKETLRAKAGHMKTKAGDFVVHHGDKIESGLEKAAHKVDVKTKGKYSDKIDSGVGKARGALGHLKDDRSRD
ncbi:antitoxin [Streptomyces sp. NBC_01537]|uniref:antitoxin n=1 Tax=Streptomyces sp. NBC_01537 TaxID=2903896 RepID=UPI003866BE09